MTERCAHCDNRRWVCENHPDRPWKGSGACNCGSAGARCPVCNPSQVSLPEMPADFQDDALEPDRVSLRPIPRGKYIGKRFGYPPADEVEHFIKCPACGGWIDCRDLMRMQ